MLKFLCFDHIDECKHRAGRELVETFLNYTRDTFCVLDILTTFKEHHKIAIRNLGNFPSFKIL
jgi:hypothetical protein